MSVRPPSPPAPPADAASPATAAGGGLDPAFLSSLTHELRNPLAPLVNALYLLRAKVGSDKDATWALDIVDRQVNDLRAMLDDTSDIARLQRGRLPRPSDRIVAGDIAQAAADGARAPLSARRQAIDVVAADSSLAVYADRARLARALGALLVHAGRAAAQSEPIRLSVEATDPMQIAFVVEAPTQNGAGTMQAEPSTPASFEAGIGVALADAVARWHGGSLVMLADPVSSRSELRIPRALAAGSGTT